MNYNTYKCDFMNTNENNAEILDHSYVTKCYRNNNQSFISSQSRPSNNVPSPTNIETFLASDNKSEKTAKSLPRLSNSQMNNYRGLVGKTNQGMNTNLNLYTNS